MADPPSDLELRGGLDRALAEAGFGAPTQMRRRPSPYRTSFPIEELEVDLRQRGPVRIGCKRLDWKGLELAAREAKPLFLHDPEREAVVYRDVLPRAPAGPPEYFGSIHDPGRHWLFVEWVDGRELYQVGELAIWQAVARWLAGMHVRLGDVDELEYLVDHDAAHYRRWLRRAVEFAREEGGEAQRKVEWLGARHEAVVETLTGMPRSFVHGEFYASNVLVAGDISALRVAPVDWELAGRGPGVTDLAALVSGGWSEEDRGAIVAAYSHAMGSDAPPAGALEFARLQLAIQWLGWAPASWVPPEGQRHDWLGEAIELAERLEL